jgi:cobalt-zinc-cadmium efflux system membrane fusion protein
MRTIPYIFLLFILISCSGKKAEPEEKAPVKEVATLTLTDQQLKQADLQIAPVSEQTLHETITVNGKVDVPPQSMISVSFPLGGYLKKTQLLPGMSVKKGEVIALIEDQSFVQLQQDYLVDKAKMEYLAADMQRQKELSENEATSKKSYQQALSEYKMVQVMIKSLEEKLRIIGIEPEHLTVSKISRSVELRSPITGFVSKVNVNIGKYVNPSDVLFELVNPDDIHAVLTVFEKDMPLIEKGMKAFVTLANNPAKKYEVEVLLATKNIDETRSGLVHCHFENANHELLPGMFLTGSFQLAAKPTKVVPDEAVVRYEGKEYAFVVKDPHNFEMVPVKTGTRQNGMVALTDSGSLDLNQARFVTKNSYRLLGMLKNKAE